ncbi:MAG: NAD(P)/FAD-dependent oxidoreductase [Lachnospiraceae bacterium]
MSQVIVIGGGAAGMMAAIQAAGRGHSVSLYEKNEKLGKKVFITGKGRCNVTNACDTEALFRQVITNPKFLYSGFYSFDNQAVMRFFEENGCPLKIERGDRVFPVSDHASDVIKALQKALKQNKVTIILNTPIQEILTEDGHITGVMTQKGVKEYCDAVILATGGKSYPLTGSTGDGYRMAQQAGHTVTALTPALVPLTIKEAYCKELQGLALKNVTATLLTENKEIYCEFGEMLFTHYGVSGPLILSAGSYLARALSTVSGQCTLKLDLKPALNEEQLDKRILRDFEANAKKQFKNAVSGLFPARLIPIMITLSGIAPEQSVDTISRIERQHFAHIIKNWELSVQGLRGYDEAIITQGGITTREINPSTMESKCVHNLYFAGEIIDVDALTGGFNLQIAWSTGYLAGDSIS